MPAAEQKEISLVLGENAAGSAVYDYKWTMEAIANIADNAIKYDEISEAKNALKEMGFAK